MTVAVAEIIDALRGMRDLGAQCAAVTELMQCDIDENSLDPYVRFAAGGYARNPIYRCERFEALLLCWLPESRSSIHDHGGNRCWLAPVSGEFFVDDYRLEASDDRTWLIATASTRLRPGELDVRGTPERDIHRVRVEARAVSLHVYAFPIVEYQVYDLATGRTERRSSLDDPVA